MKKKKSEIFFFSNVFHCPRKKSHNWKVKLDKHFFFLTIFMQKFLCENEFDLKSTRFLLR